MRFPRAQFERFARVAMIPAKNSGWRPCWPLFGGQKIMLDNFEAGMAEGVHEFVCLACRQIGKTTLGDLLDLFWLQNFPGMTGTLVSDDPKNMAYRRDVILQMHQQLPKAWKRPLRMNNLNELAFDGNGSVLLFDFAPKRDDRSFGRSRPINYAHLDELGAWQDARRASALRAAFSDEHPHRFYWEPSTAQGRQDVFYDLWREAEHVPSMRRFFVGAWAHEEYQTPRSATKVWEQYGAHDRTGEERHWIRTVKDRYDVTITPEQLTWYRYILDAKCFGDEAMRAQEYPMVEEEAFVSFGDRIVSAAVIRHLREELTKVPTPATYRYDFGASIDAMRLEPDPAGSLRIWEEPDTEGVYVVSAHPARSSDPNAAAFVCQVWRAWADELTQVAEYASDEGSMYQFAWLSMHLAGAYRCRYPAFFALEVGTVGKYVLAEIQRIQNWGYGLSPTAMKSKDLRNVLASVQHFLYIRPDQGSMRSAPLGWKMSTEIKPWLLHQLRDEIERGHVQIRSPELIDGLDGLRRGEAGDSDVIEAGSGNDDSRVVCAGYAVIHWLQNAMPVVRAIAGQKRPDRWAPKSVEARLVGGYLQSVMARGRPTRA